MKHAVNGRDFDFTTSITTNAKQTSQKAHAENENTSYVYFIIN